MKNKYVAEVEAFQTCPDHPKPVNPITNIKFVAHNRTHKTLGYDITYNRALDEKVGGAVTVERWGDGGWISIPFIGFQKNICKYMSRHLKSFWVEYYEHMGVEHPERCPIPKVT